MWYVRFLSLAWFAFLALLLGGCGSSRGVAEFQLYTQSFNLQIEQGDTVLNAVAVAERNLGRRKIERRGRGQFQPSDAAYYIENVDPPVTASIRGSLRSLKAYNDALAALANGEAASALSSRISTLAGSVIGAAAASSAAFGSAVAIPGAQSLVSKSAEALNIAAPIVTAVATRAARESFRQQLIDTYPSMRSLLATLREGTPAMHYVLYVGRGTRGARTPGGMTAVSAALYEKDRQALAGWVVLMDQTLVAMDAAYVAATSRSFEADTAGLLEASIEMKSLAEQIKKARAK